MKKILSLLLTTPLLCTSASAMAVSAEFISSGTVPVIADGYTATGNDITITLSLTPTSGADLMVVKNTGLDFISGTFSNLAQGQKVILKYGSGIYQYVADYYGGDGNDLVLIATNQTVVGWGANTRGQLGNGITMEASNLSRTVQTGVLAGKTIIKLSGVSDHVLALCSDGTIASWGSNSYGGLGDGTVTTSSVPVLVDQTGVLAGKTVVAVQSGSQFSVVLCSDGTLATWGYNFNYQLGIGVRTVGSLKPVLVPKTGVLAGKKPVRISTNGSHAVVLCSDGTLIAWGDNSNAELGVGNSYYQSLPVLVDQTGVLAGKKITSLATAGSPDLAVCEDGSVAVWGSNGSGQLGDGTTTTRSTPVLLNKTGVLTGKTISSVAIGVDSSYALCSDGSVAAWGNGTYGQMGNGKQQNSLVPVSIDQSGVLAGKKIVSIHPGVSHCLALCADGSLAAWGNNDLVYSPSGGYYYLISKLSPRLIDLGEIGYGKSISSIPTPSSSILLRLSSPDWGLSSLTLSSGAISPAFLTGSLSYAATVASNVDSITINPTPTDTSSSIQVNGKTVAVGSSSTPIPLTSGENTITVQVTSADLQSQRNYMLKINRLTGVTLSPLSHGQISGAGDYPLNADTALTATPEYGYVFDHWSGDASGNENPIHITMNGNKTVGAVFIPDLHDDDGDGLTNYQEATIFHTNPKQVDSNSDGISDTLAVSFSGETAPDSIRVGDAVCYDLSGLGLTGTMKLVGSLPAGLVFNPATGVISGSTTGKPGSYVLKLQLLNGETAPKTIPLLLRITAFPASLTADYEGLLEASTTRAATGKVSLSIAANGTWSASLSQLGSFKIRTAKGYAALTLNEAAATLSLPFPASAGLPAESITLTVNANSPLLTGSYSHGTIRGFRIAQPSELPARDINFTMAFDQGSQDGSESPAGLGWATGKLPVMKNTAVISGTLGDAVSYKSTIRLSSTYQAILWLQPYTKSPESFFGGIVSLKQALEYPGDVLYHLAEGLTWVRMPDASATSYPQGFGPLPVSSLVASYSVPASASAMMDSLGITQNEMGCLIEGAGLPDTEATVSLPESLTLADNFVLTATTTSEYPLIPWAGKLDKKTGSFTGTLKLPASTATGIIKGNGSASGVFIQNEVLQGKVAVGLLKIPISGKKGSYRTAAIQLGE